MDQSNTKNSGINSHWAQKLGEYHLLKHPFYQAWSAGKLSIEDLKTYSRQYFKHVDAFPRYISSIHTNCTDIKARQVLLDNLIDEEKGENNHPALWKKFAKGLGETVENVETEKAFPETQALTDTFFELSRSSYAEGVGALYAYENQVPEVAKSKIDGLEKFYGITDEDSLHFFKEHIGADEWHSEETAKLISDMNDEDQQKAYEASLKASQALWRFLDGVQERTIGACE